MVVISEHLQIAAQSLARGGPYRRSIHGKRVRDKSLFLLPGIPAIIRRRWIITRRRVSSPMPAAIVEPGHARSRVVPLARPAAGRERGLPLLRLHQLLELFEILVKPLIDDFPRLRL